MIFISILPHTALAMWNLDEMINEITRPTLQDNEYSPGVPVSGGVIRTGELESLSDDEEWTSTWASWSLKTLELMLKIEFKFYSTNLILDG